MAKLEKEDFVKLAGIIREAFDQTIKELVQQEIESRVHTAAMDILHTEGGNVVRELLRKEIKRHVPHIDVTVKVA